MKVVLAPVGTQGDVQPAVALAVALQARGHAALLVASAPFEALARRWNVPFVAAGGDVRAWTQRHATELKRHPLRLMRALNRMLDRELEVQFEVLLEAVRGADLLVGAGLQFAGPSVAQARGVPYRYLVYAAQVLETGEHPAPIVPWFNLPRVLNRASWWLFRRLYNALFRNKVNARRGALGLTPVPDFLRMAMPEGSILAADPEIVPVPAECRQRPVVAGAFVLPDADPLPDELEAFLAAGAPPIYFGLGSMPDPDAASTSALVLRAAREAGQRLVLSRGWADYALRDPGADCLLIGAVNHQRLFTRVAVAVHHGGAGTTAAAARAGVPQIVIPHLGDQHVHARRMYELGVAPRPFDRRHFTPAALSEALRQVIESPSHRAAAAGLGERLRRRDGARATAALLEAAVRCPEPPNGFEL